MKRYLKLYYLLLKMNFSNLLAFRGSFVIAIFATFLWGLFQFIMIFLLTYRRSTFFGWTRNEMILLSASFSIFWGLFHVLFTFNFRRLSMLIDKGELDYLLVKPIDSQFSVSLWLINFVAPIRILLGIAVAWYIIAVDKLQPTLLEYAFYMLLGICGVVLIYSVWIIVSTILIWQPRLSNIIDLLYMISGVTRYPGELAGKVSPFLGVFLLPLLLSIATPTEFLVNRASADHVLLLLTITIFLFMLSRSIWKGALRYYTGANS